MELVSVVIPTHYRSDRLKKAVDSVLAQTWSNLEIIVVSDGYDELTVSLMESFKEKDERIRFIVYDKSRGGNHARNVGIKEAKGDFIAFLDDDDIWYPTKIELQMGIMHNDISVGLVGCAIRVVYYERNIKYKTVFRMRGNLSKEILYENYIGSTSCVLLRKEVLDKCGVFDEKLPAKQDHDLWIRICQFYNVEFVDTIQLDYFVHSSDGKGQQVSKSMDSFLVAHEIMAEKYNYLYENLSELENKILISMRYKNIAQRAYETGNYSICRDYALKSLKKRFSFGALFFFSFFWIPKELVVKVLSIIKK